MQPHMAGVRRAMDPRATIAAEARPLVRAIKQRLGEEFWSNRSPDIEVIRTGREGIITVRSEDLFFFFDPDTGELCAGRRGSDGSAEFGGIAADGTIRWGWAVVNRMSLN
jgi:hypothetical protein